MSNTADLLPFTNSLEQRPSGEMNTRSVSQKLPASMAALRNFINTEQTGNS